MIKSKKLTGEKADMNTENIKEKILNILQDTELYATLCSLEEIRACDLNEILFNLFLSEGLFRSVKSIIFNPRKKEELSNKRMFNLYLNELIVSKTIAPETAQEYIAKCENKINSALKKLAHISEQKPLLPPPATRVGKS